MNVLTNQSGKWKGSQTIHICNERMNITADPIDIKRTIIKYNKQLHSNKCVNFDGMDIFL